MFISVKKRDFQRGLLKSITGIKSRTIYFRARNALTRGTRNQLYQLDFPPRIARCTLFFTLIEHGILAVRSFYSDLSKVRRLSFLFYQLKSPSFPFIRLYVSVIETSQ